MTSDRRSFLAGAAGVLAAGALPLPLRAQGGDDTLTIGVSFEPTAIDPHWHNQGANNSLAQHLFDRLVHASPEQMPQPGLATEWRVLDETSWEFKLRPGVTFHDGNPLTIEDVIFSLERAKDVPGAPFSFRAYLGDKTAEKIDDRTLLIRTTAPNPIVPNELSTVSIISRRAGEGASTADYASGRAAIGTGPYRLVEAVPGARIVMERNDAYWGPKPVWRRVVLRPVPAAGARVAALLSGDVQVIENVPPSDIANLSRMASISLTRRVTNRVIFLMMDQFRATTPFVAAKDGGPLPNVLRDLRVRRAMSLAIDREAITRRILEGSGEPAGQLVPPGIFGASGNLPPERPDQRRARELLVEAGLPDGFQLTLHSPNDRFVRDARVSEAVGQMLSRVGIRTAVDAMPSSAFYRRATRGGPEGGPEFSIWLAGFGGGTGEASPALKSVAHSADAARGFGAINRGRYGNPDVDALIEEGLRTLDDARRQALFAEATEKAMRDLAVVPLYHPVNVWALRDPVRYDGRTDERTLAMEMRREG